jgi:putative membrane protein
MYRAQSLAIASVLALAFLQCGGDNKPAAAPDNAGEIPPATEPMTHDGGMDAAVSAEPPEPASSASAQANADTKDTKAAKDADKTQALSDAQIAAVTDAANTAEIEQSKLARTKSKNDRVKKFAAMMIAHHGQAKQKQAKLKLETAPSPLSDKLGADAAKTLTALKAANGAEFDLAYISAQLEGHHKVLDAINDELLPNVKSAELKAYLEEIKPKVEMHLQSAQEMVHKLEEASAPPAKSAANGSNSAATDGTKKPSKNDKHDKASARKTAAAATMK